MKRLSSRFILFILLILPLNATIPTQQRIRLTDSWEYLKGDLGSIWEAVRPAAPGSSEAVPIWQQVTLPHCFNAEDAVDPDINYYQGAGWYRTQLSIKNPYLNGRVILEFEGAGQKTEVYVYTYKVASHTGGYDGWSVDITEAVQQALANPDCAKRFNGRIPLSVRCDNTRDTEMIPSDLSDFNLYGGLYRYVNLIYQPEVSFSNIQINTPVEKDMKNASLKIQGTFHNPNDIRQASIHLLLKAPNGEKVWEQTTTVLPLGTNPLFETTIKNPILWSPDQPQLYTCELTLTTPQSKQTITESIGFRHFEFIENGPFQLNGERLLLRGTHRHEDHAGVGAAMTEEQMEAEMKLIKEMGVNFIRLGHYQQSNIILRLCDQLGILVWEEIPWCRGGLGGEKYQAQARRMLTNMITQHRNHPSVILWGLGNENDWPNDFSTFEQSAIRAFMKELNDLSHQLDPSRMTSIRRCDFCNDIVDVYSPSIWAGWYRGQFTDYKSISEKEMKRVKHFLHVEWGGDSHAGRHSEYPFNPLQAITGGTSADERAGDFALQGGDPRASRDGDWSETYIVKLFDWHLKEQETMPWLTGTAFWVFKDFSTPLRPDNPVPYVNQKGVVERDLTKKEAYYVFQSYWTKQPMIHIYGHNWRTRWGKVNEEKEILVYSNCAAVELFVNGVSQGVKQRNSQDFPAAGLHWNCILKAGENNIKAVAVKGLGKGNMKAAITDEISFNYQTEEWSNPKQLKLKTYPDKGSIVWVEAQLTDNKGIPCLDAANVISFEAAGDGKLIQNLGTSTGSRKVQAYNGRAAIRIDLNGTCQVAVKSPGIQTAFIEVKAE